MLWHVMGADEIFQRNLKCGMTHEVYLPVNRSFFCDDPSHFFFSSKNQIL